MKTKVDEAADEPAPDRLLLLHSRRLSRFFLILFVFFAAYMIVCVGTMLLRQGWIAGIKDGSFAFRIWLPIPPYDDPEPVGFRPVSELTVWQSSLMGALLLLRRLPGLLILWYLHRLFDLYARGRIFSIENTDQIRRMGIVLIGYALVPVITRGGLYLAGLSPITFQLPGGQINAFILGLIIITIARVMSFGHAIEQDRETYI
ncbi:hypothetical protein [Sphingomonas sp. 1185]|uniref:hypothetical protein n=1 Tax=Sphingomonas sp. 1185 TaxID=3156411 RepID=UPI0033912013